MSIGELGHKIIIQKRVLNVDESGFEYETWQDFKQVWAAVLNLTGREYFAAAAVQRENTVKFILRYIKDIDTNMRILFDDKIYNITFIDNIKIKNRYLEIKAMEVGSDG